MPPSDSQTFLRELDMNGAERHGRPSNVARRVRAGARIKLWTAADRLRSNLDAAVYKHTVPGLTVKDRRYNAKDILGHGRPMNPPSSTSAFLGDLCAFAVNSSDSSNFAWGQHMLHHLAPNGAMALLLTNSSMSSNSGGEGDIRRALIEADLIDWLNRNKN